MVLSIQSWLDFSEVHFPKFTRYSTLTPFPGESISVFVLSECRSGNSLKVFEVFLDAQASRDEGR